MSGRGTWFAPRVCAPAFALFTAALSGCVGEGEGEFDAATIGSTDGETEERVVAPPMCLGGDAPVCGEGKTGPACNMTCSEGEDCSFSVYCHPDGRVSGLTAWQATIFELPAQEDGADALREWFAQNPETFGMTGSATASDFELEEIPTVRNGVFFMRRFRQRWRAYPVAGPDEVIVLSGHGDRVLTLKGAVVDPSVDLDDADELVPASLVEASALAEAEKQLGSPLPVGNASESKVTTASLKAFPSLGRVAWDVEGVLGVRGFSAVVENRLDPATGLPRVVEVTSLVLNGPGPLQQATVLGEDLTSLPTELDGIVQATHDTLSTGAPLLVGEDPTTQQPQLCNDDVYVRIAYSVEDGAVRVVDVGDGFVADTAPEFTAQRIYHLVNSFFAEVSTSATEPTNPALTYWDSALFETSSFPAGEYSPRIGYLVGASGVDLGCGQGNSECAQQFGPVDGEAIADGEGFGDPVEDFYIMFTENANGVTTQTIAHELGHVLDMNLFPGITRPPSCDPLEGCDGCVEDTSAEAAPLLETIANMWSLILMDAAFSSTGGIDDCNTLQASTLSPVESMPGFCAPTDVIQNLRDDDEDCQDPAYCDKPQNSNIVTRCCDPNIHAGCNTPDGSCETGFSGNFQTSACTLNQGYRVGSFNQVVWQLMYEQRCSNEPPFDQCEPIVLPDGVDSRDAVMRAFMYALRLKASSYKELAEHMLYFYGCTYGEETFEDVRELFCSRSLDGCEASMPVCSTCGNGVLEDAEVCDGLEFSTTCEMLGLPAGKLSCNSECTGFDTDGCTTCGNGVIDADEDCDGESVPMCSELGFGGGMAICNDDCTVDASGCETGETGGGDEGPPADGDDGGAGGCDCVAAPGRSSAGLWLVALVGLAGYRSRRRVR